MITEYRSKTSSTKIAEALELLNEAARQKQGEVKGLLTDKYSHLRQMIVDDVEQGRHLIEQARHLAGDTIVEGEEKIKEVVSETDVRVRKDPWPYISGAAVFALFLGYFMGSKHK